MFGYLRAYAPELKVSEYEAYKSAYCGFCKQLGKDYGQLWRLTLSYDFAFAKLLSEALQAEKVTACQKRCMLHPLRKRYCMVSRKQDTMLSAAAVLLCEAKIKDNISDSRWYTGWLWRLLGLVARPSANKAGRDHPFLKEAAEKLNREQAKAEQDPKVSKDAAAHPTGELMGCLFTHLSEDARTKRILYELGYQLGRYVYFTDALDDLKTDAKKGNFNPFLIEAEKMSDPVPEEIRDQARGTINRCIGGAIDAYELLELRHMKPILDNILYFGLQHTVKDVAAGHPKKREQEMEIYG